YIEINAVMYRHAVFFGPEGEIHTWDARDAASITQKSLHQAAGIDEVQRDPMAFLDDAPPVRPADAPEVLIIGTGPHQHLLPSETVSRLLAMGIGVESMSTQAAARTYNILMAEGRR